MSQIFKVALLLSIGSQFSDFIQNSGKKFGERDSVAN